MWLAGIQGIRSLDDPSVLVSSMAPLHARIAKPPKCFYQVSFLGEWCTSRGNVGNIMMNMHTGKLVHIDYGDCFEVAAKRKDWPEQVPFRLTRMFVKALEVTGVDGTLLKCGTLYMKVIRARREQILGLLETFINDPLIYADQNAGPSAQESMERINAKLTGTDSRGAGPNARPIAPKLQVTKLIHEAMDPDKLCQMFCGWTAFW
jgi:FKBP12-rapamycin complex-associated protein